MATCAVCGFPVPKRIGNAGQPRLYCSPRHRVKACRERREIRLCREDPILYLANPTPEKLRIVLLAAEQGFPLPARYLSEDAEPSTGLALEPTQGEGFPDC